MRMVLLDTSFLVKCAEYGIDLFSEIDRVLREPYELCVVSGTAVELGRLALGDSKRARAARLAKAFLARVKAIDVVGKGIVDDHIAAVVARDSRCMVATHDAELKRRVRALGAVCLVIRQQKYVAVME